MYIVCYINVKYLHGLMFIIDFYKGSATSSLRSTWKPWRTSVWRLGVWVGAVGQAQAAVNCLPQLHLTLARGLIQYQWKWPSKSCVYSYYVTTIKYCNFIHALNITYIKMGWSYCAGMNEENEIEFFSRKTETMWKFETVLQNSCQKTDETGIFKLNGNNSELSKAM